MPPLHPLPEQDLPGPNGLKLQAHAHGLDLWVVPQRWLVHAQWGLGLLLAGLGLWWSRHALQSAQDFALVLVALAAVAVLGNRMLQRLGRRRLPLLQWSADDAAQAVPQLLLNLSLRAAAQDMQHWPLTPGAELRLSADRAWLYLVQADGRVQAAPLVTGMNGRLVHWAPTVLPWLQEHAAHWWVGEVAAPAPSPLSPSDLQAEPADLPAALPAWRRRRRNLNDWWDWLWQSLYERPQGLFMRRVPQLRYRLQAPSSSSAAPSTASPATQPVDWAPLALSSTYLLLFGWLWLSYCVLFRYGGQQPAPTALPWSLLHQIGVLLRGPLANPWLAWALVWLNNLLPFAANRVSLRVRRQLFPEGFPVLALRDGILSQSSWPDGLNWQLCAVERVDSAVLRVPVGLLRDQTLQLHLRLHAVAGQPVSPPLVLEWQGPMLSQISAQPMLRLLHHALGPRLRVEWINSYGVAVRQPGALG